MFILPVRKDTPVRHDSWVIYLLIIINFAVFIPTAIFSSGEGAARRFGFIPADHDVTTVLTSMFLHADLLHILGNMFFLWMFGEAVEGAIGHTLTALSYIACGVLATGCYYLADTHSSIPAIGASGAISGMVGMYTVLFPRANVDLEVYVWRFHVTTIATNSVWAIGAWFVEQTLLGVFAKASGISFGVAFWAHAGGLLGGIGLSLALALSGFPSFYGQMLARKAALFTICPSCRRRGPHKPAGSYRCRACGARFHIDETGPTQRIEPSGADQSLWIVYALILVALGWTARQFYEFFFSH